SGVVFSPSAVEQHLEARTRAHLEMKLALRTDVEVRFQVLAEDNGPAGLTLHPQSLGAHAALFGRSRILNAFFFSFEPRHRRSYESSVITQLAKPESFEIGEHTV